MDFRIYRLINDDMPFKEFKSELLHYLKYATAKDFVYNLLRFKMIENLFNKKEFVKAFYLLAFIDIFSDAYANSNADLFSEYRKQKLDSLYIDNEDLLSKNEISALTIKASSDVISKYFLHYNIVEYFPVEIRKEIFHEFFTA